MNIKFFIPLLLFFLLFGCTSQDILLVRQTIGADINGFFDGNYDGAIPFVDVNQIVFDKDFNFKDNIFYAPLISGDLNWVYLDNYPASCPPGTAVQSIGDTLGCVALSDTNGFVTWLDANATFATIINLQDLNLDLIDLNTYIYNWGDLNNDLNYLQVGDNVSLLINDAGYITGYVDTNAETACDAGEVLFGDGTCGTITSSTDTNVYTAGLVSTDNNSWLIDLNIYKNMPKRILFDIDSNYNDIWDLNDTLSTWSRDTLVAASAGKGMSTDNSNYLTKSSFSLDTAWSIAFWIYYTETSDSRYAIQYQYPSTNGFRIFSNGSANNFIIFSVDDTSAFGISSNVPVTRNEWSFWVVQGDSSGIYLYKNGSATPNTSISGTFDWTAPSPTLQIGRASGTYDGIAVFNKRLNSTEMANLYNSGVPTYRPIQTDLISAWSLDDTLADWSGNGLDLTTSGSPSYTTGIVPTSPTVQTANLISFDDVATGGIYGELTIGNSSNSTDLKIYGTNFSYDNSDLVLSSGNVKIQSDSGSIYLGAGDDRYIKYNFIQDALSVEDTYFKSVAGTSTTDNFLAQDFAFPSTGRTTTSYGNRLTIAGAGNQSYDLYHTVLDFTAGYTGSAGTYGLFTHNQNLGNSSAPYNNSANVGIFGKASGNGAGDKIGVLGDGGGGTYSYGGFFKSNTAKTNGRSIAVAGHANNTSTGSIQIGGLFTLASENTESEQAITESSALVLDNTDQATAIFIAKDDGGDVFRIEDGGDVKIPVDNATFSMGAGDDIGIKYNAVADALQIDTASTTNFVAGNGAGASLTTGTNNFIWGNGAGASFTTGTHNIAIGQNALASEDTFSYEVAIGYEAMKNNTGYYNVAVGPFTLGSSGGGNGYANNAFGTQALYGLTSGRQNDAFGYYSMHSATTAIGNVAMGRESLRFNQSGNFNVAIGDLAGHRDSTGAQVNSTSNSIFLGRNTGPNLDGETNQIVIGYDVKGNGSNTVTLGNSSITDTYLMGDVNVGRTIIRQDGNFTMMSPNDTTWNCGVDNSGVFSCS